jgi:hypothetical protein
MTLTKNLFNEIKASLSTKKDDSVFKEFMKFESGKTYVVRLIPNITEPRNSIYHYFHHSWNSVATGQFVTALCPATYNESCPIDNYVIKTYRTGTAEEKEKIKSINRKESWLVNALVISDPTNPENEGKVKIIRYGKELAKIITSAIDGDDAQEFGAEKIFDVANGSSLRIKCEARAGAGASRNFVTYSSSKFISSSKLENISEDKLESVYNGIFDLTKVFKPKTQAELQRMLDQHYFCIQDIDTDSESDGDTAAVSVAQVSKTPSIDEIPTTTKTTPTSIESVFEGVETATSSSSNDSFDDTDAKLKELLAGL